MNSTIRPGLLPTNAIHGGRQPLQTKWSGYHFLAERNSVFSYCLFGRHFRQIEEKTTFLRKFHPNCRFVYHFYLTMVMKPSAKLFGCQNNALDAARDNWIPTRIVLFICDWYLPILRTFKRVPEILAQFCLKIGKKNKCRQMLTWTQVPRCLSLVVLDFLRDRHSWHSWVICHHINDGFVCGKSLTMLKHKDVNWARSFCSVKYPRHCVIHRSHSFAVTITTYAIRMAGLDDDPDNWTTLVWMKFIPRCECSGSWQIALVIRLGFYNWRIIKFCLQIRV